MAERIGVRDEDLEDPGCPECKRFGGNHDPVCSEYDPPVRCEECGGRGRLRVDQRLPRLRGTGVGMTAEGRWMEEGPRESDLVAALQASEERVGQLEAALKRIGTRCRVRYSGHPPEFSCLDRMDHARDQKNRYVEEFREEILTGGRCCVGCIAMSALAAPSEEPERK